MLKNILLPRRFSIVSVVISLGHRLIGTKGEIATFSYVLFKSIQNSNLVNDFLEINVIISFNRLLLDDLVAVSSKLHFCIKFQDDVPQNRFYPEKLRNFRGTAIHKLFVDGLWRC